MTHALLRWLIVFGLFVCQVLPSSAQTDALGVHDLSPGSTSPVKGASSASCLYCHAPHSGIGGATPLWNQTLSTQTYTPYTSSGLQNIETQPISGGPSSLCLSCHDGTVAPGQSPVWGKGTTTGVMLTPDVFGSHMETSHPFSLAITKDAATLVPSLYASKTTADPSKKVALIKGSVECNSCHEPHNQFIDPLSPNFLALNAKSGALCLSCHSSDPRTVNLKKNPLAGWSASIHATSGDQVTSGAKLGGYSTVGEFACMSCHAPHNATAGSGLLRAAQPATNLNVDGSVQSCITCHAGANLVVGTGGQSVQSLNVMAEMAKSSTHPFPSSGNAHDMNEPVLPTTPNRHASCADCHNSHQSQQVATFGAAPGIRGSQNGVTGIDSSNGSVVNPAVNQYQNCLRCHGTAPGKKAVGYLPTRMAAAVDPLNVISEFLATATSKHPVFQGAVNPPVSLRQFILQQDGATNSTRSLGAGIAIMCTDCHNSDDNREFGGAGPSGPHGSQYAHIMERRYEINQAPSRGALISNTNPNPVLNAGGVAPGPYALCGKCHDLNKLLTDTFTPNGNGENDHRLHVVDQGVSCSVCHTAHGMGASNPSLTGDHMVNFDLNVVAPSTTGGKTVQFDGGSKRCSLMCHNHNHNNEKY